MFGEDEKAVHRRLMGRMAATVGADLAKAKATGRLDLIEAEQAVERCQTCGSVGTCEDWLEDHVDGAEAAPTFCKNRALMARLRD